MWPRSPAQVHLDIRATPPNFCLMPRLISSCVSYPGSSQAVSRAQVYQAGPDPLPLRMLKLVDRRSQEAVVGGKLSLSSPERYRTLVGVSGTWGRPSPRHQAPRDLALPGEPGLRPSCSNRSGRTAGRSRMQVTVVDLSSILSVYLYTDCIIIVYNS